MELLTLRQAARQCKVSYETFRRWVANGHVRTQPGSSGRLVSSEDLDLLIRRIVPQSTLITGVYFARCERFVKIGWSVDAPARVSDLQVGTPFNVELLAVERTATTRDAQLLEASLHKRFEAMHVRGEWFTYDEPLKVYVAALSKPQDHTSGDF